MPEENRLSRARGRQRLAVPLVWLLRVKATSGGDGGAGEGIESLRGCPSACGEQTHRTHLRGTKSSWVCNVPGGIWSELGGIEAAPLPTWYPALKWVGVSHISES